MKQSQRLLTQCVIAVFDRKVRFVRVGSTIQAEEDLQASVH